MANLFTDNPDILFHFEKTNLEEITGLIEEDFKVFLTFGNVLLGLGISAAIGVISGFAPAWSAARMDPVEAINTTF